MTSPVPDIPFPVTLADGSTAMVHVGRKYAVTWRVLSDARRDREAEAVLCRIEQTRRHGPRLVFNGSPRFGDHPVYPAAIQQLTGIPADTPPDMRRVPRQLKKTRPVTYELCVDGEERSILDALMDAIDAATSQGRVTWIIDSGGTRIAAIVPMAIAENHLGHED